MSQKKAASRMSQSVYRSSQIELGSRSMRRRAEQAARQTPAPHSTPTCLATPWFPPSLSSYRSVQDTKVSGMQLLSQALGSQDKERCYLELSRQGTGPQATRFRLAVLDWRAARFPSSPNNPFRADPVEPRVNQMVVVALIKFISHRKPAVR